jgi:2-polyprenyl-6-methoxyphenol hydroxylase-like FAD-dependent oxidoreductase
VAGSTTAAALAREGLRVLVCEAGLPSKRRLAGELMHPPAAGALETLGLLEPLKRAGAVESRGFAVFRGPSDAGTHLSYAEIPGGRSSGLAIEHHTLSQTLLDAVAEKPGVWVWQNARVVGARLGPRSTVTVRRSDGSVEVSAGLLVSAEGRSSKLRDQAGMRCARGEPFVMVGWRVPGGRLPLSGYGHVFLGGPTPTLAYSMAEDEVRIMFELELGQEDVPRAALEALPRPFRSDVERAMRTEPRQLAKVFSLRPAQASSDRLAVVGDAGGSAHPLTASGLSFCVRDAVALGEAVALHRGQDDYAAAVAHYDRDRRGPLRARMALADALMEVFTSDSAEARLLRHGLFRYWAQSGRGRSASMGLLSTERSSMAALAREAAAVSYYAVSGLGGVVEASEAPVALSQLFARSFGYLRQALAAR